MGAGEKKPHPQPLSEWNNPTQPPPRGGVPNGSRLGKGILNTKGAFLHIEETPFSLQRNALFKLRRAFLVFVLDVLVSEVLPRYTETI